MTRRCRNCQKDFPATQSTACWCSDTCCEKWKYRNQPWYDARPKTERSCRKCQAPFLSQWPNAKFCKACSAPKSGPCAGGCGSVLPQGRAKYCASCRPFIAAIRDYKVTVPEYRQLQDACGGKCFICGGDNGGRRLALDHCHKTGDPRGLLCIACNNGLGLFHDSPAALRKAAKYLEQRGMRFSKS